MSSRDGVSFRWRVLGVTLVLVLSSACGRAAQREATQPYAHAQAAGASSDGATQASAGVQAEERSMAPRPGQQAGSSAPSVIANVPPMVGRSAGSGGAGTTSPSVAPTDTTAGSQAPAGGFPDVAPRASEGCRSGQLVPGRTIAMLESSGIMRSYILYVPRNYDDTVPTPLLLDFHGATVDASAAEMGSGFRAQADEQNYIYVAPNGIDSRWEQREGARDVRFVRDLVAALFARGCVDRRRVYATGCSSGGGFTYLLMCSAEDLIAAVAPLCGGPFFNIDSECALDRPVPHILFLGRRDIAGCWEGTYQALGSNRVACAKEIQRVLIEKYDCQGEIRSTHDGVCETADRCAQGSEVVICGPDTGHVVYSAQVAQQVWAFLERFVAP